MGKKKSDSSWRPDVYTYIDYRAYLRDYYEAGKANTNYLSHRYLSRQAGFSSPNFIKLVMDGKRNLGDDSIPRLAKALKMSKAEQRFFGDLVHFDQATDPDARNAAFELVASRQRFRQARRIDSGMYAYLSHWFYPAIREMTGRIDFREDPAWIAAELIPHITTAEATEALEILLDLGLVVRDDEGRLHRGSPSVTSGHEVSAMAARNYHVQMLERAAGSITLVSRDYRDLCATTVCIQASTVADLKQRIHHFHEVMLERCEGDDAPDRVYQINTQLFPLTLPQED